MCALAPLLADVTTSAAVRWTLCREAEKHCGQGHGEKFLEQVL